MRKKQWNKVDWEKAPDIKKRLDKIISSAKIDWVMKDQIHCMRSTNSSSHAYARIWGLSRIWQIALGEKPAYIIEVLTNRFDKLSESEQDKVLVHELAHIPKNFSGSLMPHIRKRGKRNFNDRIKILIAQYNRERK